MLKIEYFPIKDLIPYENNSRTHSADQVDQVVKSISEFGFTNPILIDENNGIIAGHCRKMAAEKLKLESVPCIRLEGLSEAQRKAYVIADNKLALNAGWDEEMLQIEFESLKELDFNLELTGFWLDEIDEILQAADEIDMPEMPTEDPEFQQKTFTFHNDQVAAVEEAISLAKKDPLVDTGINENSNGNALTLICEQWLQQKT